MPKIVDHGERREELLAALWRVVDKQGAAAVSVRSVAAEAGVSKSSLAHYFPSQAALVAAAIEQVMDESEGRTSQLDLDDADVSTIVSALSLAIPDSPERRAQAELWLHLAATAPDNSEILERLNDRVNDALEWGLNRMADTGLLGAGRSVEDEAGRLHALVDGLALQVVSSPTRMTPERVRTILTRHVEDLTTPLS